MLNFYQFTDRIFAAFISSLELLGRIILFLLLLSPLLFIAALILNPLFERVNDFVFYKVLRGQKSKNESRGKANES